MCGGGWATHTSKGDLRLVGGRGPEGGCVSSIVELFLGSVDPALPDAAPRS